MIQSSSQKIEALPIPYPYQGMFTLCSDLDETPDWQTYAAICRFLNTTDDSPMGPGLGLEIGNSLYFDMPDDQFAYWNTSELGREMTHRLIQSGHIDAFHSFGDLCTTRSQARKNIEALQSAGCELKVWIDHAQAISNFGADIMQGQGDVKDSESYHADLTLDAGVEYVWVGRVTSVIGQNTPRSLRGLIEPRQIGASVKTVLKEFAKGMTSRLGKSKYDMHVSNQVLRRTRLRDGQPCYEFLRADPHWAGVGAEDSSLGLADSINRRYLDTLCTRNGISIHYTHLGKISDKKRPFTPEVLDAMRLLEDYANNKKILVTTTRRILDFCRSLNELTFSLSHRDDYYEIQIETPSANLTLDGLSFELPGDCRSSHLRDSKGQTIELEITHDKGRCVASAPWPQLQFPELPDPNGEPA